MAHRPTGLAPVEHRLLHKQRLVSASRPHRARPGGAQASAPEWSVRRPLLLSSSLRSTETSSVGAGNAPRCPSGAEASAPPRQARWGRGTRRAAPLVQKPPLHRDKLGGAETSSVGAGNAPRCPSGAEASAPPRQARWGRGASRARGDRGYLALCQRHRHHKHHAVDGDGVDARDWHPASACPEEPSWRSILATAICSLAFWP